MSKRGCELLARAALSVAMGFGIGQTALSQVYSVTDLGPLTDLSGRNDAKPNAVNASGMVAAATVAGVGSRRRRVTRGASPIASIDQSDNLQRCDSTLNGIHALVTR